MDLAAALAQFGTAGLVGWLWLAERRGAQERERQLGEAHARLVLDREHARLAIDELVRVVKENTRAVAALLHQQERVERALDGNGAGPGRGAGEGVRGEAA